MANITSAEASRELVEGHLAGQGLWPVSVGGAAHLGHRATELLIAGYPFRDLVATRPNQEDLDYAVTQTLRRHRAVARQTPGARVNVTPQELTRTMPGSFLINWCSALAGVVGAATGRQMETARLLEPGDPDFEATAAALESGEVLAEAERLLDIADHATMGGLGFAVAGRYQDALTPGAASVAFPAEVIAGGRDAIRRAAISGPNSHIGRLVASALNSAGETSPQANAMAHNLVIRPDASLLALGG